MPNQTIMLRELTPLDTLTVLSKATEQAGDEGIQAIHMRTWSAANQPDVVQINVTIPDPNTLRRSQPARRLYEAIDGLYRTLMPDSARYIDGVPPNFIPLRQGLAQLLATRAFNDSPARSIDQEYLLVVPGTTMEHAAQLQLQLARFTTSTSVAPFLEGASVKLHLFHILHDRQRNSAFQSLLPGITSPLLAAYEAGAWIVFADPSHPPGRAALAAFAKLVNHAPSLFSAPGRSDGSSMNERRLLAALVRWPGDPQMLELLYLRHLVFTNQVRVEPHVQRFSGVVFSDLQQSAEAVQQLRTMIGEVAARLDYQVGYTLQLRSARAIQDHQRERARLQAQKEEIENRLEYLDSTEPPRMRLLRFTEEQLPALGDYVGSCSIREIENEALRYAFQSLKADGTGMHYILVDPRQVPLERMDPLPAWEYSEHSPIRFWLDPFWARYYHDQNESLVFVPEGSHLSPMMHAPSAEAMDSYLSEIVGQWFHGRANAPSVPPQPLYLFEPDQRSKGHVMITVLDAAAFVPMTHKLDWINANLHVRMARLRGEEILKSIDDAMTEETIVTRIQAHTNAFQADLRRVLQTSAAHITAATGAITELLSTEMQAVLGESETTRVAINTARQQLRQLTATHAEVQKLLGDTTGAMQSADQAATRAVATTEELHTKVEAELHKARVAHDNAQHRIDELEELVVSLSNRLAQR